MRTTSLDVVEDEDESDVEPIPNALARLRGALRQLDGSEDVLEESAGEAQSFSTGPASNGPHSYTESPKIVAEYVRRGTRLIPEEVSVPSLSDLLRDVTLEAARDPRTGIVLPPQVWPYDKRRTLLLRALASDLPSVARLPDGHLVGVATLRWVVRTMHQRSQDSLGVKERFLERWTQAEARAVLASLAPQGCEDAEPQRADQVVAEKEPVVPTERHIQLVAQVTAALDAIEQLSQVLLLSSEITTPARQFSGTRCHTLLSGPVSAAVAECRDDLWQACVEGLEDAYALPPQKKAKKAAKGSLKPPAPAMTPAKRPGHGLKTRGLFDLLADAET